MPGQHSNHFADRLHNAIREKQTPLLVGLDPRANQLPDSLAVEDPKNNSQVAAAYQKFCCEIIDVVADLVPAVKPQAAFFEQAGPQGMMALAQVVDHAQAAGFGGPTAHLPLCIQLRTISQDALRSDTGHP